MQTPQGYLRCDAYLTRAGIFQYRDAQGNVTREFRPPSEVFAKDSLESIKLVPVTMTHPPEGAVDAQTAKKYQCGSVGEFVKQDGEYVNATMMLTDAKLVAASLGGDMREISCGYTCEIEEVPGTYNGEDYDVVQRDIRYNHVAVVPRGRAGREVRLHIDAEGAVMVRKTKAKQDKKGKTRRDGDTASSNTKEQGSNAVTDPIKAFYKTLQDAFAAYQDATKGGDGDDDDDDDDDKSQGADDDDTAEGADDDEDTTQSGGADDDDDDGDTDEPGDHAGPDETAEQGGNKGKGQVAEVKTKKDKKRGDAEIERLRGENEALRAKLSAKKSGRTDAEKFQARVSRRVNLERQAAQFLGNVDMTGMTNTEVKAAVVKKMSPELKLDAASDSFVDGAYAIVLKSAGDKAKNISDRKASLTIVAEKQRQDEGGEPAKAYAKMIEDQQNAWKPKASA